MKIADLIPRRAAGLPPGQREVRAFPRFSDAPLRWAPVPGPIQLTISIEGEPRAVLDEEAIATYPVVDAVHDFHCVTTWTYRGVQWGGVLLVDVLDDVMGREPLPPFAVASTADKQHAIYRTEDLTAADVMLATHRDGAPLDRKHGAPLRLVCPRHYGYKNPKHLLAIDFRHDQPVSTLGPKEHLRARVDLEERHSTLPNWALRVPYRMTVIPTALAAERGLRTSPN